MVKAMAAFEAHGQLKPFEFSNGELKSDQVDIAVKYCGVCHSDLSMLENEWHMSAYPFVPGHEVVGTVAAVGREVKHLKAGDTVGLGWYSGSCLTCPQCVSGNQNLCPTAEGTIVGRYGGFANMVRAQALWTIPLPSGLDASKAGPLFCGGITVFNPLVQCGVLPTHRVGVIGVGGLGHLALQFLNKWGCEVTAFSSSKGKYDELKKLGAHHVVDSKDSAALSKLAGKFDFIISTVNVPLKWDEFIAVLAPKGRLHFVGAVGEPLGLTLFPMISAQRSVSASPLGSPATTARMLEFCARHSIAPVTEQFKLSDVNKAFDHLRAGKARYRLVLQNDI
jgi:uncharacterized zinc-type alcohol dehydrogenase-like protein